MLLSSLQNYLEDFSPQHTVLIRLPDGQLANITYVRVQHDLGVVIIEADAPQPLENAPVEPLDASKAPMGVNNADADIQGTTTNADTPSTPTGLGS